MRTMRKPMKRGELKQEGGDECGPLRHSAPMDFGDGFYKGAERGLAGRII